ncbi:MAG: hypothetical protein MMC33_003162 [Icmadophila ericetorum]|nr:hypothetical protein [Icmadophila ericetorum]
MRLSLTLLAVLPTLIAADAQQKPLQEVIQDSIYTYLNKAKTFLPQAFASPIDAGASKVAAKNVTPLTKDNWKSTLTPSAASIASGSPESWMVFVSGGNKTCFGRCEGVEQAWNQSAALFAADPKAPNLGYIDCDRDTILCSIWVAGPPAIWYIQLPTPAADQSKPATTIHITKLNTTTTTTQEILQIHTEKKYEETPVYEGYMHPFDGQLTQFGLNVPVGYIMYGFSVVPSWVFMIGISMFSRTLMSKRIGNPNVAREQAQAAAQPRGGAPAANNR